MIMSINPQLLYQAFQAYRRSENLGDAAILKSEGFGATIDPAIAPHMSSVVGYHPKIDLDELSQLPAGTFGYEYAQHMKANNLRPFNISEGLEAIAQRNVFALRYVVTHDIFHVLLGFDTSYAGEIGVLAFAAEQGYSRFLKVGLVLAKILYPVLAPRQFRQSIANVHLGQKLAREAEFLLGYRFEEHWDMPLEAVRVQLGLPANPQAGSVKPEPTSKNLSRAASS
jgi:ubiquinone biosynthesis protein COQ4